MPQLSPAKKTSDMPASEGRGGGGCCGGGGAVTEEIVVEEPPFQCTCLLPSSGPSRAGGDNDDDDDDGDNDNNEGKDKRIVQKEDPGAETEDANPTHPSAASSSTPLFTFRCRRDEQARQLQRAFDRCCQEVSEQASSSNGIGGGELILVTGPSGCGKTCLVESVNRSSPGTLPLGTSQSTAANHLDSHGDDDPAITSRVITNDGDDQSGDAGADAVASPATLLVSGKFDQLERRDQYYAIVQALTELALILARESSPEVLQRVKSMLAPHRETVAIVADLVPDLRVLLEDSEDSRPTTTTSTSPEGGTVARERLQLGLRRLFSSLCSPSSPIVLFLDDLQWAEPASLDVLASLYAERIPGLVIVGACRDNEVDPASYLCVILRELEARSVAITQIMVSNVSQAALCAALADSLGSGKGRTASGLARILHDHTGGNVFFATQLVRYLVSEGVLYRTSDRLPWTFDSEDQVREAIGHTPDVVSLLAMVIRKQDREVQDTLMVAACLGAEFSELVLREAVTTYNVTESLQIAETMQFLRRSSHDAQMWRFAHDRIQESAYSLIPIHEREQVHLRIGRNLWGALSDNDIDTFAHVVVKQLRLGERLITDPAERELLATLLLRAGELAAKASAHATAHEYVTLGIQLLEPRHWRDQYRLSLALYNAAAEIEYCLGNFLRMDALVAEIMVNARDLKDKVRAQTARIYSLGSRNELDQAIDVGLWTLKTFFGEHLPSKPSAASILTDLFRTKRLLRGRTDEALMSMPPLDDFPMLASIRIMCLLLMYAVLTVNRPTLVPVLAMRIVQHSLRRGLCGMSSIGFGYYGMVMTMFFNDIDTGIRYGNIALRIVDRFDAVEQLARVSTVVHLFCLSYTKPLPELLAPLRVAHRVGLGSGDIEHSLIAAGVYAMVAFSTCRPLSDLADDVSNFLALTNAYNHAGTDLMFRPLAQFLQCLRGQAPNPSVLTGSYVEWESALKIAKDTNHGAAASMIVTFKLVLEGLFRSYTRSGEDAVATALELHQPGSGFETAPCFMKALVWLHQGLACMSQSHKDGFWSRRHLRCAKQCHRKLVRLSRHSESNYGAKALLLGAELMVTTNSYHQGLLEFDAAIQLSKRSEMWSDAGLACERLSWALQSRGRSDESMIYLNQAVRYYERWGATAKGVELQTELRSRLQRGVESPL